LLDGSYGSQAFQVGANANETISVSLRNVSADAIGSSKIAPAVGTTAGVVDDGTAVYADTKITLTNNNSGNTTDIDIVAADDASTIAKKFNDVSATTGVKAQAYNTIELSDLDYTTGGAGLNATIGGAVVTGAADDADLVDQINTNGADKGISAAIVDGKVQVTQAEGKDIAIVSGNNGFDVAAVIDGTAG
ncbi:flagellin hook IN motif-containing protein, partial [Shewanella sp. ECSMB14102]